MVRLAVCFLLTGFCFGQSWSGILTGSRAISWTGAGLPSTFPDGETAKYPWAPPTRTQCGTTIASGASPSTINSALASCGSGHYVLLGSGTFTVDNAIITLYAQNGVTLRGSGPGQTYLDLTGTGSIQWGAVWNLGSAQWISGYTSGTTQITAII
jgi:hypothetical protein